MKNSPGDSGANILQTETVDSKSSATAKKVKECVLYLAGSEAFEKNNCPVTIDEENFKRFLALRKERTQGVGIPVDFGKGLTYFPVDSFFVMN